MKLSLEISVILIILIGVGYIMARKDNNSYTKRADKKIQHNTKNALKPTSDHLKRKVKPEKRINIGGREEVYTLPVIAQLYVHLTELGLDEQYNRDIVTFRCSGVILAHDLILTSSECLYPVRSYRVYFDVTKKTATKIYNYTQEAILIKAKDVFTKAYSDDDPHSGIFYSGDVAVYELPQRMKLDSNAVYQVKVPHPQYDASYYDECRVYGYGGDFKLRSMKVEEVERDDCHQKKGVKGLRTCMKAEVDYNLCQTDAGNPVICTKGPNYFVYGLVADMNPWRWSKIESEKCSTTWSKDNKFISVTKMNKYYNWLTDLQDWFQGECAQFRFAKSDIEVTNDAPLKPAITTPAPPFRRRG